jgi:tetratricopeptide (TPR) repeat protein
VSADPTPTQGESTPPTGDATLLQGESAVVNGPVALPAAGRYQPLRFHARGGLGEVFLAEDRELRREIALKFIRPGREQAARRRFVREAEITGRLEHPGIVPVYGLLDGPADRPCYAMRFIRGESLADAVERYHAGPRDTGSLRRLLTPFVTVCQVIAYAHSKGVIHRDIKPANVMLGPFGETYVVDWGLATDLSGGTPSASEESDAPVSALPDDSDATQTGSLVGTPAYMSPEQAAGDWRHVGPAADVFSLGATLYAILAGRPPYQGRMVLTVLEDAQAAKFLRPRAIRPNVPPALEAVCLKAMAKDPAERYPSAAALAADVERWLADEPVTARREPWSVRAWRWVRRHRTSVTGAAALLLTAVIALAVGLVVVGREQRRTEERRLDAEAARHEADDSAHAAAEQRNLSLETLKSVVTDVQAQTRGQPGMQVLQKRLLQSARQGLERVARAAEASGESDRAKAEAFVQLGDVFAQYPDVGGLATARDQYDKALTLARRSAAVKPDDRTEQQFLAECLRRAGTVALASGRTAEADRLLTERQTLVGRLAAAVPDDRPAQAALADALGAVGQVRLTRGRPAEAVAAFEQARGIYQSLEQCDPTNPTWPEGYADASLRLGDALFGTGQKNDALEAIRAAMSAFGRRLTVGKSDDRLNRRLGQAVRTAAIVMEACGLGARALENYRYAVELFVALERRHPDDVSLQADLAHARQRLGYSLWLAGLADEANVVAGQARETFGQLARADPANIEHASRLAETGITLINLAIERSDAATAVAIARDMVETGRSLAVNAPDNMYVPMLRANAAATLGMALEFAGDRPAAGRAYAEAADLLRRLRTEGRAPDERKAATVLAIVEARTAGLGNDLAVAAAAADRLAAATADGWFAPFHAACVYGSAIMMVGRGRTAGALSPDEQARVDGYVRRGLELLERAVSQGLRSAELIRRVPDLAPFRDRPEYIKLLAGLKPASPPK